MIGLRRLLLSVILFTSIQGWSQITLAHPITASDLTSTTNSWSFPVTTSSGSSCVASFGVNVSGVAVTGVTDNKINSWTQVGANTTGGGGNSAMFRANSCIAGVTTLTITTTGVSGTTHIAALFYDLSGTNTGSFLAANTNSSSIAACTSCSGPSVTATGAGIIISVASPANSFTAVSGTGWVGDQFDATVGSGQAHNINASSGPFSPTWTQNASGIYNGITAAFNASGGAAAAKGINKKDKLIKLGAY